MVGGRGKIKEDIWTSCPATAPFLPPCRSLAVQLAFFTV
jgi:hypothetical protein